MDRYSDDWRENGPIDDDRREERDWDAEYEADREREAKLLLEELPPTGGEEIPF